MTQQQLSELSAAKRVAWLNSEDPFHQWAVGQGVFCLHCDGVFRAEDVACDDCHRVVCPVCRDGMPHDFGEIPWWREDMVKVIGDGDAFHGWPLYRWSGEPITAESGKPKALPRPSTRHHFHPIQLDGSGSKSDGKSIIPCLTRTKSRKRSSTR
jgi:hypothetical protein